MTSETMTSQTPNNTNNNGVCFRSRAFLFTLNEVDKYEDFKECFLKLKSMDYFLASKEIAPSTGHEHIHIYIHFESNYKLSKKILSFGAHIDIQKYGSPNQIIKYVKKDGDILDEIGKEPHQGFHTVKDLQNIENPEDLKWNEFNIWSKIKNAPKKIKKGEWHKNIKVYWICGPSGIGKSNYAEEIFEKSDFEEMEEIKYSNGFYNGVVDGKGLCIYDDFRDSHMSASEFINFIDYRVHNMNVKGGNIKNNYEIIIITSIQKPDQIYRNCTEEFKEQWLRRIEIIDLYKTAKNIEIFNSEIPDLPTSDEYE